MDDQVFDSPEEALAAIESQHADDQVFDSPEEALASLGGNGVDEEPDADTDDRAERIELQQALDEIPGPSDTDVLAEAYALDTQDQIQAAQIVQSIDPQQLAMGVYGALKSAIEPEQKQSPGSMWNTIQSQKPPGFGMEPFPPQVNQAAYQLAAVDFPSLSRGGTLMDPQDKINYSMAVMENTMLTSPTRAQVIDDAGRFGYFVPEALPDQWYQARGLPIKRK